MMIWTEFSFLLLFFSKKNKPSVETRLIRLSAETESIHRRVDEITSPTMKKMESSLS